MVKSDHASNEKKAAAWLDPTALVNDHWPAVYRMLSCMTGNGHDAEDLTQETFLRALASWDSFQPGTNLRAWLLRIASNAFCDVYRKKQRLEAGPLPEEIRAPLTQPERGLEQAEQGVLIQRALMELPETPRMVFHLRVSEDLSFREIGAFLGLSEETARWHMHQARGRLLTKLGGKL